MNLSLAVLGNIALVLAAIPAFLFVVFYSLTRWEKTPHGRQTMALGASIAAILASALTRLIFDSRTWEVVRFAVFLSIIPVLWWRLALLVQTQREYRGRRLNTPAQQREEDDAR